MKTLYKFNIEFAATIMLLLSIVCVTGCNEDEIINPVIDTVAGELPLLNGNNKIGMIVGFNPSNPVSTNDSIQARWQEALDAGMSVGRLQIDWTELETAPNTYDKNALENRLIEYQNQNLQTFLLISAYDSEGPVVPADLQGLSFDDSILINRFYNLMDWVIPMLVEYDGYIISITNEADNQFNNEPELPQQILKFLKDVKSHIHEINEKMAVTVTIAEGSLDDGRPGIPEIINECDVACWNFYGSKFQFSDPYYVAQSDNEIRNDIRRLLDVSGEKNIVIQELGMYSGNTSLNSSQEIQRKFFEIFFEEMIQQERIKAAYNFQLVDWSPEVTELYSEAFEGEGLPQGFIDQLSESLETMGLINYSSGTRKSAWNEFIYWMEQMN
ncbi:MAG: hypothetical protein AAF632_29385 [Bacteroidota bacterium]